MIIYSININIFHAISRKYWCSSSELFHQDWSCIEFYFHQVVLVVDKVVSKWKKTRVGCSGLPQEESGCLRLLLNGRRHRVFSDRERPRWKWSNPTPSVWNQQVQTSPSVWNAQVRICGVTRASGLRGGAYKPTCSRQPLKVIVPRFPPIASYYPPPANYTTNPCPNIHQATSILILRPIPTDLLFLRSASKVRLDWHHSSLDRSQNLFLTKRGVLHNRIWEQKLAKIATLQHQITVDRKCPLENSWDFKLQNN